MTTAAPIVLIPGWGVPASRLALLHEHLSLTLSSNPLTFDPASVRVDDARRPSPDDEPSPYARALHSLLLEQNEPALVIGWSMGAMIALETACIAPDTVRRLVLISPTACFCVKDDYPHGQKPAVLRAMMTGIRSPRRRSILKDFWEKTAFPHALKNEESTSRVADALEQGEFALSKGLEYLLHTDLRSTVSHLTQPALIIHGTEDKIIPATAGHWLSEHMSNALFLQEEKEGHDLPLRYPDRIARHVRDFAIS